MYSNDDFRCFAAQSTDSRQQQPGRSCQFFYRTESPGEEEDEIIDDLDPELSLSVRRYHEQQHPPLHHLGSRDSIGSSDATDPMDNGADSGSRHPAIADNPSDQVRQPLLQPPAQPRIPTVAGLATTVRQQQLQQRQRQGRLSSKTRAGQQRSSPQESQSKQQLQQHREHRGVKGRQIMQRARKHPTVDRIITLLQDKRIDDDQLEQIQDLQLPLLRKILNVIFISLGVVFLLGVIVVIVYTNLGKDDHGKQSS